MKTKKATGSYYTPSFLTDFIVDRVAAHHSNDDSISILEPSAGDGSFLRSIAQSNRLRSLKNIEVFAVEKEEQEIKKAKISVANHSEHLKYFFFNEDFLEYQLHSEQKYDIVIGNPPYIKKTLLDGADIANCHQIHTAAGFGETTVKNIWSAFLLKSCQRINSEGTIALVLPSDLLQVKFSNQLRHYLVREFARIEIFTFDDLMFECKGQDTILLFAFKHHQTPGQYYAHISDTDQLVKQEFTLNSNEALSQNDVKWSHHLLSTEELNFLHEVAGKLQTINAYCDSRPGIVTAANEFFIINNSTEEEYQLSDYTEPIIQKGFFVNGSVEFNQDDYAALCKSDRPSKLLKFKDQDVSFSHKVENYLSIGESIGLPDRYKCKMRNNWYVIPNISRPTDGFFFKRSHKYPKLLKNTAKVHVTDSGYKITMREGYQIDDLIYSFYNSLTLAFAELRGRYYGGGVLELTPSEFKSLPIPFTTFTKTTFAKYCADFKQKKSINAVLEANDKHILSEVLQMNPSEINLLNNIYIKLVEKRLRAKN
ncbi:N-6 DNA methylase [Pedobacter boryungensis]|uniref:site-specific DNA-methyltransferase (adenine-specific) n=1 Tax=Pedobacter boryungensis TaxID=869962 RepID=A0ABX2DCG6_9SPHI|nr:N-6 DNA methylase [Pedobacter boryungensis]NQX31224.1 N-6 DNA methylase [Pedobacter boryungensis]